MTPLKKPPGRGNSIRERVRNCVTEITAWRRPHWFWWKGNLRQRPHRPCCTRSQIQVMGFSPEVRSKAFQYEMPQYPDPDHASAEDRFFPNHRRYFFSHQVFWFSEAELLDSKTFWEVEKNCGKSEKLRSEKRRVWRSSEVATCKSPTTQSRRSSQSDCQGKVQQVQLHSPGREKSRRKLERNGEDDDPSDFVRLHPDHHRNRGNHWRPLLWWVFYFVSI